MGQQGAQLVHGPGGQIVFGQEKHCILEKGEKQIGGLHKEGHSGIGVYAGGALWQGHGEALMVKCRLDGVGLEILVLGKKVLCLFRKEGGALTPPRGKDGDAYQQAGNRCPQQAQHLIGSAQGRHAQEETAGQVQNGQQGALVEPEGQLAQKEGTGSCYQRDKQFLGGDEPGGQQQQTQHPEDKPQKLAQVFAMVCYRLRATLCVRELVGDLPQAGESLAGVNLYSLFQRRGELGEQGFGVQG